MNLFDKTGPLPPVLPQAGAVPISGRLDFDAERIAGGLVLEVPEVVALFRDGRRSQPIIERRLREDLNRGRA